MSVCAHIHAERTLKRKIKLIIYGSPANMKLSQQENHVISPCDHSSYECLISKGFWNVNGDPDFQIICHKLQFKVATTLWRTWFLFINSRKLYFFFGKINGDSPLPQLLIGPNTKVILSCSPTVLHQFLALQTLLATYTVAFSIFVDFQNSSVQVHFLLSKYFGEGRYHLSCFLKSYYI